MSTLLEAIGILLAGAALGTGGTILVRSRAREREARARAAAAAAKAKP